MWDRREDRISLSTVRAEKLYPSLIKRKDELAETLWGKSALDEQPHLCYWKYSGIAIWGPHEYQGMKDNRGRTDIYKGTGNERSCIWSLVHQGRHNCVHRRRKKETDSAKTLRLVWGLRGFSESHGGTWPFCCRRGFSGYWSQDYLHWWQSPKAPGAMTTGRWIRR